MIRIIVADQQGLMRAGICSLINSEKDFEVVDSVESSQLALDSCKKLKPEILVLDYEMPDKDGLEVLREIIELKLNTKVLVLSNFDSKEFVLRFISNGASGYLCKSTSATELNIAIRKISLGNTYFSTSFEVPELKYQSKNNGDCDLITSLSNREYQIFIRIAKGKTMGEVAHELNISYSTVKTFKYRIFEKLSLKRDSELTFFALNRGLIEQGFNIKNHSR